MNIGIVGFGKMGMLHAAILNQMDNVNLIAISEKNSFIRSAAKSVIPNFHYYKEYNKMIDSENLDAIIVCTPPFTHIDIAEYAIKKNIHVFIEKPLSNRLDTAQNLKKILTNTNKICMVGYCMRYTPTFKKAKKLLDDGVIGIIKKAYAGAFIADVFKPETGWRYDSALSGGGVVIEFSVHMIDLLCWYFGEVASLSAITKKLYSLDVEDEASIDFIFVNGCKAKIDTSWSKEDYRKSFFMIEISGSLGTLKVTDQTILIKTADKEENIYYPDVYESNFIDIAGGQYSEQMVDFVNSCTIKEKSQNFFESAFHVQNVVDAIYRSAQTGEKVDLEEQNGYKNS